MNVNLRRPNKGRERAMRVGPNIARKQGVTRWVRLVVSRLGLDLHRTEHRDHANESYNDILVHPRETNPFRVPLDFNPLPSAALPPPPPPPCFLLFFGADAPAVVEDLRFLLPLSLPLVPERAFELVVQPPALRSASARRVHQNFASGSADRHTRDECAKRET